MAAAAVKVAECTVLGDAWLQLLLIAAAVHGLLQLPPSPAVLQDCCGHGCLGCCALSLHTELLQSCCNNGFTAVDTAVGTRPRRVVAAAAAVVARQSTQSCSIMDWAAAAAPSAAAHGVLTAVRMLLRAVEPTPPASAVMGCVACCCRGVNPSQNSQLPHSQCSLLHPV